METIVNNGTELKAIKVFIDNIYNLHIELLIISCIQLIILMLFVFSIAYIIISNKRRNKSYQDIINKRNQRNKK